MWERGVDTVKFSVIPIDPSREIRRWKVLDIAGGSSKELGILTMNDDESTFLINRLLNTDPEQNLYQNWLYERMMHPEKYSINGKPLINMSWSERLYNLNIFWNAGKTVKVMPGYTPPKKIVIIPDKEITKNGTYSAQEDEADGYSSVIVNVPVPPEPVLIDKTVTDNGTYEAESDNADGYSSVKVDVYIPPDPVLIEKAITENGSYKASDDNSDGYSNVLVNIPDPVLTEKSVTENGTYEAEDDGSDGYSKVTVAVPDPVLTEKSVTENGTYTAASDEADGYSKVTVAVPDPVLTEKSVTENGTYEASDDQADGYSRVMVNVPGFIKPIHSNVIDGYVNRPSSGNETSWIIQLNSSNRSDIFQVKANTRYIFSLSNKIGNRFVILFSETDPYGSTQNITGIYVNMKFNQGYNIAGSPQAYSLGYYTTPSDGFITITKTNKNDNVNLYMIEIPVEATDQ